ncbi:MAG: hypothetical protein U0931_04940 [Vulcanimicrobiota bacterium]
MALIAVLLLSMVLLMFVLCGLEVTGHNLFMVGQVHEKNKALYAAEAGVFETMAQLEGLDHYPTPGTGPVVTLGNGARYQVSIERNGEEVVLHSTGYSGGLQKKLRVQLTLSSDSFFALTNQREVDITQHAFVNAVESTLNPIPGPGNIHTNSDQSDAMLGSPDPNGGDTKMSVTGEASAVGQISVAVAGKTHPSANFVRPLTLDVNQVLGDLPPVDITALPGDGKIEGHMRISSLDAADYVHIPEGAVLHVTGDAAFGHGVGGAGTLVVDGSTLIRAHDEINLNEPKGLFLYSAGNVTMLHPEAVFQRTVSTTETTTEVIERAVDVYTSVPDPVSDYFASMPKDAGFSMRQSLPLNAPTDLSFFTYLEKQSLAPDEAYRLWMDGDNTVKFPGLPPAVKGWLHEARTDPVVAQKLKDYLLSPPPPPIYQGGGHSNGRPAQ